MNRVFKLFSSIKRHPLAKRRPLAFFSHYLYWRMRLQFSAGKCVTYPWLENARFYYRRSDSGINGNVPFGLLEYPDMPYILHVLRRDDTFIDVGANVGAYTILASAVRRARTHCFEPIPETYQRLKQNIDLNEVESLATCWNLALADKDGTLRFTTEMDTMNHAMNEVSTGSDESYIHAKVMAATLDSILPYVEPCCMKIDVEGYELHVLKGAQRLLKRSSLHTILVELNGLTEQFGVSVAEVVKFIQDYGFTIFDYDPVDRVLTERRHAFDAGGNVIFVREPMLVNMIVQSAPEICIHGIRL